MISLLCSNYPEDKLRFLAQCSYLEEVRRRYKDESALRFAEYGSTFVPSELLPEEFLRLILDSDGHVALER